MKKNVLLLILGLAIAIPGSAQSWNAATVSTMARGNKLTLDAQLQMQRQASMQTRAAVAAYADTLHAIIKLDETRADKTLDALRTLGVKLQGRLGQQVSAAIPFSTLQQVEAMQGVLRIGTGGPAPKLLTDVSRGEVGVLDIDGTRGTVGSQSYSGRGVTVAVIDGGFDYQHPAFKDSEGRSRIKAVYSPYVESGRKVVIDGMELPGSVFDTPEQIAALTTDYPMNNHGSHTSCIAAGTHSPQGWGGMAPDADIVLCNIYAPEASLATMTIDNLISSKSTFYGLVFLRDYAKHLEQPIVVNMSLDVNDGSHNGKGVIPEAIEALCQEGVPVVISAGNEGDRSLYLHKDFESDTDTLRSMIGMREGAERIEGFAPKDAELCMRLSLVRKDEGNIWTTLWQSPMLNTETGSLLDISSESQPLLEEGFSGNLRIGLIRESDQVRMGIYSIGTMEMDYFFELTVGSKQGVGLDLFNGELTSQDREGYASSVNAMSQNDWASAPSCISVGTYVANTTYRSLYEEQTEPDDETLNDIATLSSYGTSFNGVHVPTICAPGVNVVSAVSHFTPAETDEQGNPKPYRPEMTWQGFPYNSESGTSMAAPTVSGIIALWLEASPMLSPAELKDFIVRSARTDSFTEAKPDRFGNGKIDAKRGLEMILQGTAIKDISDGQWNETGTIYDLQGRSYSKPHASGIYINRGKKIIVK